MNQSYQNTLPVTHDGDFHLDSTQAIKFGQQSSKQYQSAAPFPHMVFDHFLPEQFCQDLLNCLPGHRLPSDSFFIGRKYEHNKRRIQPEDCGAQARNLFRFFNSLSFVEFLSALSGIKGLIPDPHYLGGGYHMIGTDGKLGIHADFRIHPILHLHRRINVLVYLNNDWKPEYGGALELWKRDMSRCEIQVLPIFNRCVIFNTDADSFHGHPEPLQTPPGVYRKSIALYYYTASQAIYKEVPNLDTNFQDLKQRL